MLYSDINFIFLLVVTFAISLIFPKQRIVILICSSLFFYAWVSFFDTFIFVLFILVIFGLCKLGHDKPHMQKSIYGLGIFISIAHLLFWKYNPWLKMQIPLGISFYTLQTIAYLIDVKKGRAKNFDWQDFLFFKTFFAQLLAGPIVRAKPIYVQIKNSRFLSVSNWSRGVAWFALGFFQKVFIADQVAPLVNQIFLAPTKYSTGMLIAGGIGFITQINCDFAGYSHMAIGIGLLFGFKLPFNFYSPVYSQSPIEIWSRWHITLTEFMRDYIFQPLMSLFSDIKFIVVGALFLIFILTGLWHDISFKFVVWGLYSATLFLITQKLVFSSLNRRLKKVLPNFILMPIYIFLTFFTSFISMTLFRAVDLSHFFLYLSSLQNFKSGISIPLAYENIYGLFIIELIISGLIYYNLQTRKRTWLEKINLFLKQKIKLSKVKIIRNSILFLAAMLLIGTALFFAKQSPADNTFIYFQF